MLLKIVFAGVFLALSACMGHSGTAVRPQSSQNPDADSKAALKDKELENVMEVVKSTQREYRISAHDLLEVIIFQEDELTRKLRVSASGMVTLPLIGALKVGGLTLIEAENLVAQKLANGYLVDPQVTMFVKEYYSKKVYILGQVKHPGSYEIPAERGLTVLEAIALAGGFTNVAAADRTRILRTTPETPETILVKASDITKGDKSKDILLEPNDIVFVPETLF